VERPRLEVADIFCAQGPAFRQARRGHLSLGQLKVMSAIERCRTAELGGHRLRCENDCPTIKIAYHSCRNRHCPKCQGTAANRWLEARQADLLPINYFHAVFTLPEPLRDIAYQNKRLVYELLFKAASETLLTLAADPKRLGAKIGITAVLHTWGSSLVYHPHLHCIVTGGGLANNQWVRSRPKFLVHVNVLSARFMYRFLKALRTAHDQGQLTFFGSLQDLTDPGWFAEHLRPLQKIKWVVDVRPPFAGPETVLAYLSRYTHRIAISNRRLVSFDERGVTFRYKDYRAKHRDRWKSMTLQSDEFIRRFLLHVLPRRFHRIRHYGLFANAQRKKNLAQARVLLNQPAQNPVDDETTEKPSPCPYTCPTCGGPMIVIEVLAPNHAPRAPPPQSLAA
jgi:hypothetical protein